MGTLNERQLDTTVH